MKDALQILIFIAVFLIIAIVNIIKFVNKTKGQNVDWQAIFSGKKQGESEDEEEYWEEEFEFAPEQFQENVAPPSPPPTPSGELLVEPMQNAAEFETPFESEVADLEPATVRSEALPSSQYGEFIRLHGKSAILISEILGKPKAMQ